MAPEQLTFALNVTPASHCTQSGPGRNLADMTPIQHSERSFSIYKSPHYAVAPRDKQVVAHVSVTIRASFVPPDHWKPVVDMLAEAMSTVPQLRTLWHIDIAYADDVPDRHHVEVRDAVVADASVRDRLDAALWEVWSSGSSICTR